jgi:hypothetical protein
MFQKGSPYIIPTCFWIVFSSLMVFLGSIGCSTDTKNEVNKDIVPPFINVLIPNDSILLQAGSLIRLQAEISDDRYLGDCLIEVTPEFAGCEVPDSVKRKPFCYSEIVRMQGGSFRLSRMIQIPKDAMQTNYLLRMTAYDSFNNNDVAIFPK